MQIHVTRGENNPVLRKIRLILFLFSQQIALSLWLERIVICTFRLQFFQIWKVNRLFVNHMEHHLVYQHFLNGARTYFTGEKNQSVKYESGDSCFH